MSNAGEQRAGDGREGVSEWGATTASADYCTATEKSENRV